MCSNPMNVYVTTDRRDETFLRDMRSFCGHRKLDLINNTFIFKFFGLRIKRVCWGCYKTPVPNTLTREIGVRKKFMNHSISRKQLYEWFKDFHEFRQRKDLDLCILPKEHQSGVRALAILLT